MVEGYESSAYLEYVDTESLRTNVNVQAVKKVLDSVDQGLADMFEIAREYEMLDETWEQLRDLVSQHKCICANIYEQVAAAERIVELADSQSDMANEKTTPKSKAMPKHSAERTQEHFQRTGKVRSKPY